MNWLRSPLSFKLGFWMVQRRLKNRKRTVVAANLKEINKVCLLVNLTEPNAKATLQKEIKLLKNAGKKEVDIIAFKKSWKEEDKAEVKNWVKITPNDFNWLFHPNLSLKNLILTPYDLLIFIGSQPNKFLLNYLALSKAKFKVGIETQAFSSFLDMTIKVDAKDQDKFINSLNHYLNLINKPSYAA